MISQLSTAVAFGNQFFMTYICLEAALSLLPGLRDHSWTSVSYSLVAIYRTNNTNSQLITSYLQDIRINKPLGLLINTNHTTVTTVERLTIEVGFD